MFLRITTSVLLHFEWICFNSNRVFLHCCIDVFTSITTTKQSESFRVWEFSSVQSVRLLTLNPPIQTCTLTGSTLHPINAVCFGLGQNFSHLSPPTFCVKCLPPHNFPQNLKACNEKKKKKSIMCEKESSGRKWNYPWLFAKKETLAGLSITCLS